MTEYSLRYFEKENKYYIEIRDDTYFELEKRIRRLKRESGLTGGMRSKNVVSSEVRIALLTARKEMSQKYVCIAEKDIPPKMKPRPMYKIVGTIMEPSSESYRELVSFLAVKYGCV